MKLNKNEIDILENKNSFKTLIDMCRNGSKCFRNDLLNYESIDLDVMVYYLNLAIITYATVKFKDMMTYMKLSNVVTMFEEDFAILVLKSNFN